MKRDNTLTLQQYDGHAVWPASELTCKWSQRTVETPWQSINNYSIFRTIPPTRPRHQGTRSIYFRGSFASGFEGAFIHTFDHWMALHSHHTTEPSGSFGDGWNVQCVASTRTAEKGDYWLCTAGPSSPLSLGRPGSDLEILVS